MEWWRLVRVGLDVQHGGDQETAVAMTDDFEGGSCRRRPSLVVVVVRCLDFYFVLGS